MLVKQISERQQYNVQEPTKHQYDWDVATTMGFLNQYGLSGEFKLNVECNHATLAGHSCDHELQVRASHPASGTPCQPVLSGPARSMSKGKCQVSCVS